MKHPTLVRFLAIAPMAFLCIVCLTANAALLIPRNASWKYQKGDAEASNPIDAWRATGFDDGAWSDGDTPIRYGDGSGGTVLNDMRNSYSTLFLRRTFNVTDVAQISQLDLIVDYDDGFMVWINGTEVLNVNGIAGAPAFNSFASGSHESGSFETFNLPNPQNALVNGQNTIAIHVFNVTLNSSDLMMNPELVSTAPDLDPPTVLSFTPAPGIVLDLSAIAVIFSEPVTGVDADDLTINDVSAVSVSGSAESYTFTFGPGTLGPVTVEWSQDHGIVDTAAPPNAFDSTIPGEVRAYTVVDELPPTASGIQPPPGVTLRSLEIVSVTFSESVTGVDPPDLLANGTPAASVTGAASGPYEFTFTNLPAGAIDISWATGHGITDLAADPNPLATSPWSYTIDPNAPPSSLLINEIVASNRTGITDEDGETSDWIELHNFGATPVDITGWSLSDDVSAPGKFVLPGRSIAAGGYLIVFASGKDRAQPGTGQIHTSFKLAATGEYLGLFTPDSPRAVADELGTMFPEQRNDHSYGRDSAGALRYFSTPTPNAPNGDSSLAGVLPMPEANTDRGFYDRPFDLHLTSAEPGVTIRYTTDGSEPTGINGAVYSGPITINSTTAFRAASFKNGHLPSRALTHTYLYNVSSAQRSLAVVSIVTDNSNLFGPTGIMETSPRNTTNRGIAWERPTSAELIRPEDNGGFQFDAGLRVQGGNYVRGRYNPNGSLPFSKYSFRIYFRGDYGPKTLNYPFFENSEVQEFDRFVLRAGMNDHSNPYIVDELMRRLFIDTGHVGSRGNFVNLFINGQYKGYYNPTERIDDDFLRSWHGGDNAWDVIAQFGEVREGDSVAWNNLLSTINNNDMSVPANYQTALDLIDADNFIDYLLVNITGGTGDWPHNNWRAARERVPGAKFRFYIWDAEWSLGNLGRSVNGNTLTGELGGNSEIAAMYRSLTQNSEFRIRFADRVHRHFYNGGALEDGRLSAHYEGMRAEMSGVLPGMSTSIRTTWIPQRRGIIMDHMASADLQHSDIAPVFSQHGGSVPSGYDLEITAPLGGTLYFTADGSDPREPITADTGGFTRTILEEDAPKRVLVPSADIGTAWTGGNEPFGDSAWIAGTGGVGYDEASDYDSLIDIDVDAEMNDVNTSCYVRIPFAVSTQDLDGVNFMQIKARYDDGFVAYLNGIRVASANGPPSPVWNSPSSGNHSDSSAVNLRGINISDFLGDLKTGENLLAIHGLNDGIGSSDFLISVTLEVGENIAGDAADTAIEYTAPVPIGGTTTVKARTLRNQVWSALTEAEFFFGPEMPQLRITEIMYHPTGGSAFEFVELHNAGIRTVDLSRMQFDGVTFAFAPGTTLGAGEYIVIASNDDPDAFATRYPGVIVAGTFAGSLSNGGERLALLDPLGNTIVSADYDDDNGWPAGADGDDRSLVRIDPNGDPDDPANWAASAQQGGSPGTSEPAPPAPEIRLNEVLAEGAPDWVEFHNSGATPVSIAGWGFSDQGDILYRFAFPAGAEVPAGGFLTVMCDSDFGSPGLHSGFGLDPDGETLFLTDASGARVDAFSFGPQISGHSMGIVNGEWTLTLPTADAANGDAVELAPQSQLSINEWLANPLSGEKDWLELFNTDTLQIVALRGLHIQSGETTFRYGALGFLAPGRHLQLLADEGVGANHLDFKLPADGTTLALVDAGGEEFETVAYGPQDEDVTEGRLPDGSAAITSFANASSPGAQNYQSSNPGLVLNEVLAASSDGSADWIEIRNTIGTPFDLTGMSISIGDRRAGQWIFPDAFQLAGGTTTIIDCDTARPLASVAGNLNTGNALSSQRGAIYLFDSAGREIDRVRYGTQIPGMTIGRIGNGTWTLLDSLTRDGANAAAASLGNATSLRINEWLAKPADGYDDFVELFNTGAQPVRLVGLRLTDDLSIAGIDQFEFPPLSFVAGGGFAAFTADGNPGNLPFNLDASGETLRLYSANASSILDEVTWGIESEGVSSGRTADGGTTIAQLPAVTRGFSNASLPDGDDDNDGLPNAWEDENGLDRGDPNDALADSDGDKQNNLEEFAAGTDPQDASSSHRIESIAIDGEMTATLEFTAKAGIRYTVEFTDDLTSGGWGFLVEIEPSTIDRIVTVEDPSADPARYYRVVAERDTP